MLTGIRLNQFDNVAIRPDDQGMEKLNPECSALIEMLLQNPSRVNRY